MKIGEPALVFDELGTHTELARIRLASGRRSILPSLEHVERSPMLGIYAAYSAFQRAPDDKHTVRRCLRAIPAEVRVLTDVQLLEAWLDPDAAFPLLQPLDIPLLTLAWDLSRRLPPEQQLAPDLRGLLGQWRIGGSLWTSWRRPTRADMASLEGRAAATPAAAGYDAVLAAARRSPAGGEQPTSLDPPWEMEGWRARQDHLRTPLPRGSPFQQALRRRLLDAIALQEDVVEEEIFRLGAQYDLDRKWTTLEYRSFHELRVPTMIMTGACSPASGSR